MTAIKRKVGDYYPLTWDGDGEPGGLYVNGHVSYEVFYAEIDRWFGASPSRVKPQIPPGAKVEHVYVRAVRVVNDDYGNRAHQWRHANSGRPMTYLELCPNLNSGG